MLFPGKRLIPSPPASLRPQESCRIHTTSRRRNAKENGNASGTHFPSGRKARFLSSRHQQPGLRSHARDARHSRGRPLPGHHRTQFHAIDRRSDFHGRAALRRFRSDQIFLSRGRTTEAKQALYRSIAQRLANSPGIRPDDVMIVLTEVGLDDWSFARGEAQYVLNPPAWARKQEKLSA